MSTIEKAMAKLKVGSNDADEPTLDESSLLQEEADDSAQTNEPANPEGQVETIEPTKQKTPDNQSFAAGESENSVQTPEAAHLSETKVSSESDSTQTTPDTIDDSRAGSKSGVDSRAGADTPENKSAGNNSRYVAIDTAYLDSKSFVTKDSENRVLKEQFRAIKRKLINNAFGSLAKSLHFPNLIIVTSCNAHEGKTFSSINLALNIALEKNKTVLLVDSDVVRPSITNELGVEIKTGLTEYLAGEIKDVSDIMYSTNIDNFKFIPAGHPHNQSSELLASEKMHILTKELATRYSDRIVIFDAPPLLGVNETHVMANLVGQAIIVVEENETKLNDIEVAVSQLDKDLAIGYLVNKSRGSYRDHYGYGYYYSKKK